MSEKSDKLRPMLEKEKERRIKLNNRIEILERRIQEEDSAEVNEMVRTAKVTPEQLAALLRQSATTTRTRLRCPQWVLPLIIGRIPTMKMMSKVCTLLLSAGSVRWHGGTCLCLWGEAEEVEQPVLPVSASEDIVTVTDETSGALTPEGNLTLVDDYHTNLFRWQRPAVYHAVSASRATPSIWSSIATAKGSRPSTL